MGNANLQHPLCLRAGFAVLCFLVAGGHPLEAIDHTLTQRIWKEKFGVTDAQFYTDPNLYTDPNPANGLNTTWLAEDDDSDGATNAEEMSAGTDPFDPADSIAVIQVVRNGSSAEVQFPTKAGKRYRVETTTDLSNPNSWVMQPQPSPVQITGIGGAMVLSVPYVANTFYRVRVDDIDEDGDNVSSWVEEEAGLDPHLASTESGLNDYEFMVQQLDEPNVVTITASKPFASEDGPESGMFTVTRTRRIFPQTVTLAFDGTAVGAVDYAAPSLTVDFEAKSSSANVSINPLSDTTLDGSKSVIATVEEDPAYTVGANNSATVIIKDSTVPSGTGLLARYYDHASSTYAHAANFGDFANYTFTRGTPTTTGTILVTPTQGDTAAQLAAVTVGEQVKLSFNAGNLNNALYNHQIYTVSAKTGTNFTCTIISETTLPTNSSSSLYFSLQSVLHPPRLERVDPTVDFEWMGGTPNGNAISPANSPDNYSAFWEGFLHPTTSDNYQFQLDADDKARVFLDRNDGNGLVQILEHGWDGPATIGTFKQSVAIPLTIPANAAQRYRIRVEHVETTGEARCRLQWRAGTANFANIPSAQIFTHTAAMNANYSYTRTSSTAGAMTGTISVTLNGHGLAAGNTVDLAFSSGVLFTPGNGNFHGTFTVSSVTSANVFVVPISAASLPTSGTGAGFVRNRPTSTTAGWFNMIYANTGFIAPPGRVGTNTNGTNDSNNGLWGTGTPDADLINPDTFSARWTGQVQPQFTEEYTISVLADDGCILRINGVEQDLKMLPSVNSSGSTYSYNNVTGDAVVTYANSILKLGSVVVGETLRMDPSNGILALGNGSSYTYDSASGDAVINYSNLANVVPGGFVVGETVEVDPTSGSATTLAMLPYQITAVTANTFTVNFGAGLFLSGSGSINVSDVLDRVVTAATDTTFTVNYGAGKYATGTGNMNFNFVNKSIKPWASNGNERYVTLPMVGGVRYDIQLDYWENTGFSRCRLFWMSPSQPKQIIPSGRLYPSSDTVLAPAEHLGLTEATALVGGDFSYVVEGSNGAIASLSGMPAWLSYENGVLSGTPPQGSAGIYQIVITFTNANGTSTSVLNLTVDETDGSIEREVWTGIAGTAVSGIPVGTAPSGTNNLTLLEAETDSGDNYGARIRGYITAPETGNYYFWIAGSNSAELWISNDDEPINSFKRAWVAGGTAPQQWNAESNQKSPWMALKQGKRYYIEILHKAGAGAGDNLAVGWSLPGGNETAPDEIVPGYVLSTYVPPAPGSTPGTLYVATMLSQGGAITNGVGTATLRLSEDETVAYVAFSHNGLTGQVTDWHVHSDPFLTHASAIIYDGTEPLSGDGPQPDGTHKWNIVSAGTLSAAEIIELLKQGKAFINLHTAMYPAGEIRGNFTLANGSRTFTAPPPPPSWTDDNTNAAAASRFLTQSTFGPSLNDIVALQAMPSYEAWIDDQFNKLASEHLPEVIRTEQSSAQGGAFTNNLTFNTWWWRSVTGEDQLRQRIAFALSEIHVVSGQGPLLNRANALSYFYDRLLENAFGNFRDIIETTTLTPTMGRYLDMLRNDKPNLSTGRIPNENYAREVKQLFSVGLYRMWPDGTLMLNSKDAPIDTYSQNEIVGYSHVFTGWDYGYDGANRTALNAPVNWTRQMRATPARHFTGPKLLLNNEVLPGLRTLDGQPLDPYATHISTHYNHPDYKALPDQELAEAHDQLFNHPNVGPFICRQLIQRLVTSHPSRDYLYRVVQKFNDNGSGVRGDMKAVIKAILLDYEARSADMLSVPAYGKQREPVLRVTAAGRAFRKDAWNGTYAQNSTDATDPRRIQITTSQPHGFSATSNQVLDFTSGNPAPWIGTYSVARTGNNTLRAIATGWATGTYSIPADSSTCTVTMSNHWLQVGHQIFVNFYTGGARGQAGVDEQVYTLLTASAQTGTNGTFTFAVSSQGTARSGNVMIPRFTPGSYTSAASGLPAPHERRVTMDVANNTNHELQVGDQVQLNFTAGNPLPVDMVVTVDTVVDLNTWTFLATATDTNLGRNQSNNNVYQFPLKSLPLDRSGDVGTRPSTFAMNNTTLELDQAPLNSPTVFNFYLPDFKFPGALASQGITTPEFQETAETSVIRQANFLYNGIMAGGNDTMSSFINGTNAVVMNFSQWMTGNAAHTALGNATSTTVPWTHRQNLNALIDQMSTLLMAGQLSAPAKQIIHNFVATPISAISVGSPCTVTTSVPHRLTTGTTICISGVTDGTFSRTLNSTTTTSTITVDSPTTFRLNGTNPVNCTVAPSGAGLTNAHVSTVVYNQGTTTPSNGNRRDRIRAILHLILTSPDFTIQR